MWRIAVPSGKDLFSFVISVSVLNEMKLDGNSYRLQWSYQYNLRTTNDTQGTCTDVFLLYYKSVVCHFLGD